MCIYIYAYHYTQGKLESRLTVTRMSFILNEFITSDSHTTRLPFRKRQLKWGGGVNWNVSCCVSVSFALSRGGGFVLGKKKSTGTIFLKTEAAFFCGTPRLATHCTTPPHYTTLRHTAPLCTILHHTAPHQGKTGVTADRDKIEFRLLNSSSIFNIALREELLSSPQ